MAATLACCFSTCSSYPFILNKQPPPVIIFTNTTTTTTTTTATTRYRPVHCYNKPIAALPLVMDTQHFHDTESEAEAEEHKKQGTTLLPCQLYVCNLPSAFDISELLHLFTPFGTIQSVEVTRDPQTGLSRGCGYVTTSSIYEAKSAIAALDGSDVGGRELRVMFAVDVENARRNVDALNSTPKKDLIFESPYKLYAGNLTWSTKPEDLREIFCQFGTVVSARVLQDRKAGKSRVYGFLSFSSPAELEAAMALNGTDYRGRKLVLREVKHNLGLNV